MCTQSQVRTPGNAGKITKQGPGLVTKKKRERETITLPGKGQSRNRNSRIPHHSSLSPGPPTLWVEKKVLIIGRGTSRGRVPISKAQTWLESKLFPEAIPSSSLPLPHQVLSPSLGARPTGPAPHFRSLRPGTWQGLVPGEA